MPKVLDVHNIIEVKAIRKKLTANKSQLAMFDLLCDVVNSKNNIGEQKNPILLDTDIEDNTEPILSDHESDSDYESDD